MSRVAASLIKLLLFFFFIINASLSESVPYACDEKNATLMSYPFCTTTIPTSERVSDYVARLTLEEKISQLVHTAAAIPRLGVPAYQWWSEALHGVANTGPGVHFGGSIPSATSFPMPILTAASFNASLFLSIGQAVSTEARAMHNVGLSGLTFWSPNINIFRDPRWGRGQETPGEDPSLSSVFAVHYVKGLQDVDDGSDKLKVSACCKHMTAYDVDNWQGTDRYHFNAIVSKQDLEDTYNAPFKSCVEDGGVSSVMCSYNRVNGVPTCADAGLLTETVRNTWNLNGYIVSDCDSIDVFFENTKYATTAEDAAADVLLAGLNLNCGTFLTKHTLAAIQQKKVTEAKINEALTYLVTVQMRLGLFDGNPASQTYGSLGAADVCSDQHQQLARDAARQGIVLLKNNAAALPFSTSNINTLAVIGPHANATKAMIGNYAGIPCKYTTPLQGLSSYLQGKKQQVFYAAGCSNVACASDNLIADAVTVAGKADAVVLFVGLDLGQEAESFDRTSLLLPGNQQKLVEKVAQAARGPVILVIFSGGSVDVGFAKIDDRIGGIIWAGYPGEAGGAAIAEIIFGDCNPGGKLPITWYPQSFTSSVSMLNMNMRPDTATGYPGRTYRFYTGPTLYKFGDGLCYSSLSTKFHSLPKSLKAAATMRLSCLNGTQCLNHLSTANRKTCDELRTKITVSVHNNGDRQADHAILLFSKPPNAGKDGIPQQQLVAFDRISIQAHDKSKVVFNLDPCKQLSHSNSNSERILHSGIHTLIAGESTQQLLITP